jgi:hypothetical protein
LEKRSFVVLTGSEKKDLLNPLNCLQLLGLKRSSERALNLPVLQNPAVAPSHKSAVPRSDAALPKI